MSQHSNFQDGNGRLWERFSLSDINDRLENIYNHLKDVVQEYGSDPPDYSPQIREIKQLFDNHQLRVKSITQDWNKNLNAKDRENRRLKDEIKRLKANQNNNARNQALEQGIDAYVQSKTQKLKRSLQTMQKEKEDALQKYEQEKRKHSETRDKMDDFHRRSQALTKIIEEMRSNDKYNINSDLQNERDELQKKYNALLVKYEKKRFELDDKVADEINQVCDAISNTKPFDIHQAQQLWRRDLKAINEEYEKVTEIKEKQWKKAKEISIKKLDTEYGQLADGYKQRIREQKEDIDKKNKENEKFAKRIKDLETELRGKKLDYDRKGEELMETKTELAKYKILWEHFFGLDRPLKDHINAANTKLSKIEKQHHIEPPFRKKRKVQVERLTTWLLDTNNNGLPPLMIDVIPINDNDPYKRFALFNHTKDSLIFKKWSIKNGKNQSFRLMDNIEIGPRRCIYIALNKVKKKTDILAPSSFDFKFRQNEKLFLADNYGQKIQIFPRRNISHSLTDFEHSPLKATPFGVGDDDAPMKGVILENATGKNIKLINMALINERNTFRKEIPNIEWTVNTKIRLGCYKNDNQYIPQRKNSDLIIKENQVNQDDDTLFIVDKDNYRFQLYQYEPSENHNHNGNIDDEMDDRCFVM